MHHIDFWDLRLIAASFSFLFYWYILISSYLWNTIWDFLYVVFLFVDKTLPNKKKLNGIYGAEIKKEEGNLKTVSVTDLIQQHSSVAYTFTCSSLSNIYPFIHSSVYRTLGLSGAFSIIYPVDFWCLVRIKPDCWNPFSKIWWPRLCLGAFRAMEGEGDQFTQNFKNFQDLTFNYCSSSWNSLILCWSYL